jgi:hypothetical protein
MKFIIDVCHVRNHLFDSYDKKFADTKFGINGQINVREVKSG